MGNRQLRQQAINEKAIFSLSYASTCLHASDLAIALWLLHVVFRENQMPILLLETLFPLLNMSIFNNFNIALAPSKISSQTNVPHNRCSKFSRVSTRNGFVRLKHH